MENEIHKDNIKLLEYLYNYKFYKLKHEFDWKNVTKINILNSEFCIIEYNYNEYVLYKYELI